MYEDVELNISTTEIIDAAVRSFNNRKYRQGAQTLSMNANQLMLPNGMHALNPPYSHYRRSAIILAGIARNEPNEIASLFGITEKAVNDTVKSSTRSINTVPQLAQIFYQVAAAAGVPSIWLPKKEIHREEEEQSKKAIPKIVPKKGAIHPGYNSSAVIQSRPAAPPPPQPSLPVRMLTLKELVPEILSCYNHYHGTGYTLARLQGKMEKNSTQQEVRNIIALAARILLPDEECPNGALIAYFGDTPTKILKGMRDAGKSYKNPYGAKKFVEGLGAALHLSTAQANHLKACGDIRFRTWKEVFEAANAQNRITAPLYTID